MKRIYLDHAATSPIHPDVMDTLMDTMKEAYGNPSSTHAFGRKSHQYLEEARQVFAKSLNAKPSEIVMTSCGTESDNMAVLGTALARQSEGKHIISTAVEHTAVKQPLERLEEQGFEVTYLPVNEEGRISVDDFKAALREDTILVTIMYSNNEVGTVMPIQEIGHYLKDQGHPAYFHTDAVQAYGLLDIDVEDQAIDLLSVSSHKLNGPKGIGFLYMQEDVKLPAMLIGGGQESGRRAGTENIPSTVAFAKAVEIAKSENRRQKYLAFADQLMAGLDRIGVDFEVNGDREHTVGHVLNLHFPGVSSSTFLVQLDLEGIAVSAGSACSAGTIQPSPVLTAMYGPDHPALSESIRFSFGLHTTKEEIDQVVQSIEKILK